MKTVIDQEEVVKVEKLPTDDLTDANVTMQVNIAAI